jgi:hypothetical protein
VTTSKIEGKVLADAFAVDQDRYVTLLLTRVLVDSLALAESISGSVLGLRIPIRFQGIVFHLF